MARNRQRSKQRQAERRARRLQQQGPDSSRDNAGNIPGVTPEPIEPVDAPGIDPELAVGAPPQDEGRSDEVVEDEPRLDDEPYDEELAEEEALEQIEDWEVEEGEYAEEETPDGAGEAGYAVRGRRGRAEHEEHKERGRVVQFLIACWAELQRVQWPNRQALVTLTGVVLGFVLIAGGYLGLLDAIFSELIKAIL
jgi:preprotein translocase SecE subunit